MNDKETRELIERLRKLLFDYEGPLDIVYAIIEADDALENTLWKPVTDMPDALKDGRRVLLWSPTYGPTTGHYDGSAWILHSVLYDMAIITHYREITPPQDDE